ncbi:hypothetical protein LLE49_24090 [Alicyclobacillus tolerans]|uniref:hypothetical protein n=1 Tax=Alicyclobacillus tolerans TaxID=90970 RepID=UPI001F402AF3|nr:hypothetical protein [Alicyclobacillus tolerans]MCF8567807.1 hypothetical protein [Alicyclobacillus tolerans]
MFWRIFVIVALLLIVIGVPLQYKALNRMAFGRSMFIFVTSVVMGLVVGMQPSIAATVIAAALFIIGYGFLILMSIKSFQRLRAGKR